MPCRQRAWRLPHATASLVSAARGSPALLGLWLLLPGKGTRWPRRGVQDEAVQRGLPRGCPALGRLEASAVPGAGCPGSP